MSSVWAIAVVELSNNITNTMVLTYNKIVTRDTCRMKMSDALPFQLHFTLCGSVVAERLRAPNTNSGVSDQQSVGSNPQLDGIVEPLVPQTCLWLVP